MSLTKNIFNESALREHIGNKLNADMLAAAEPIIKAALIEAERVMRERLAAFVISTIERSYDVMRCGDDIRITVKMKQG